jgi:hypothetical protein
MSLPPVSHGKRDQQNVAIVRFRAPRYFCVIFRVKPALRRVKIGRIFALATPGAKSRELGVKGVGLIYLQVLGYLTLRKQV